MDILKKITLITIIIFTSGCKSFIPYSIKYNKDWEAEKAAIEKKYKDLTNDTVLEIEKKQIEKNNAEKNNLQKASSLAYSIYQLSEFKPVQDRTRPDVLINFKSKELVSRLPDLTIEEILQVNEELKKELDEKNTSLLELQKKYNEALKQAETDKKAILEIQNQIDNKKIELNNIQKDLQTARLSIEIEQRKAAELQANKERIEKENAEKKQEIIKYLVKIFIGIGVLCAIGAYALRSVWFAAAAAGSLSLSIFIAFVEPWIIITSGIVVILSAIAGIFVKLYKVNTEKNNEKALADRLVGSIEETKGKIGIDAFKKDMAPIIDDWIKDVPQLKSKIDQKLKDLNLK